MERAVVMVMVEVVDVLGLEAWDSQQYAPRITFLTRRSTEDAHMRFLPW